MDRTHLLFCLLMLLKASSAEKLCTAEADIAFVIDSSSSIWKPNFDTQIKFVQEIVKMFDIGPDSVHVAALTFADKIGLEFFFSDYDTKEDILDKVGAIEHAAGLSTYTHDALKTMRTELFSPNYGARPDVSKICILLTDGKSTFSHLTEEEATFAKQAGIKIIAIGIGKDVNEEELENIVSDPAEENYFYRDTFDDLNSEDFQDLVGEQACGKPGETTPAKTTTVEPTTPEQTEPTKPITTTEMQKEQPEETCQGKEADVVLIVDMSSSIWVVHFDQQLQFLSEIISKFDIDSGKTRVGMLLFSDNAVVQFYLDQYKTKKEIQDAIQEAESAGGITNTHLALQKLLDEMLTKEHGSRPGVAHICILITDGRSSKSTETLTQAELVHSSGVYVFAIGVGNMTDTYELSEMASSPEYAYTVDGYKALPEIQNILAYKTCEVPQGDQAKCTKTIAADVMFGLYGIGGGDREHVMKFIQNVGGAFDLKSGNVRIGMRESCGRAELQLSEFMDADHFGSSVSNAMEMDLSGLLYDVRHANGVPKQNADMVSIIIVSGVIPDIDKAFKEANRMKFNSRVIVVGVGEGVDNEQLKQLASYKDSYEPDNSHVFMVDNAKELSDVVKKLHVLMCSDQ